MLPIRWLVKRGRQRFLGHKGCHTSDGCRIGCALTNYAVVKSQLGIDLANTPGAGAAGGLGAGMLAFTQAKMQSGISLVVEATELVAKVANVDVAFVGEGAIDFQTQYGKTLIGATRSNRCKPHQMQR